MTEADKSQWCPVNGQQAQNNIQETSQKHKKKINCEGSQMLELVARRSCAVSVLEGIQT